MVRTKRSVRTLTRAATLIGTLSLVLSSFGMLTAKASTTTYISDTMSRLKTSTLANHQIDFQLVNTIGIGSASTITVTFGSPSDFTMGTFNVDNVDLKEGDTGCATATTFTNRSLGTSPGTSIWGVSQSSNVITFTNPSGGAGWGFTGGRCIRIIVGSGATNQAVGSDQITNPSSAANYSIAVGGSGLMVDSGSTTVTILSDDQVAITATVNQTLTFTISASAISFGTLSPSAARWANTTGGSSSEVVAHTLTAATNAENGYTLTEQGATLTNGAFTITAIGGTATASTPGTKQFGFKFSAAGGSGTVSSPYATANYANAGSVTPSQISSASGPSNTTTYSATYIGNIDAVTQPGAYSTSLTYVLTGLF